MYGTAWIGTGGSGDCSKEVCALCLEGSCKCGGGNLSEPARESHVNCQHDMKPASTEEVEAILERDMVRYDGVWKALA